MRVPLKIVRPWEPFGITFIGDPHLESPHHARELFEHDMNEASKRGDSIVIMGDVFDAILFQDKKRSNASHMMDTDSKLNRITMKAVNRLKPWVNNIDLMLVGNHETAVMKYHSYDPVGMLLGILNSHKTDGAFASKLIHHGGYTTFLGLQFVQTAETGNRIGSYSQKIYLHHGAGGGAPVTKGMIDAARIKVGNVFDVGVIGHKHTHIYDGDRYRYMDDYGNIRYVDRDFFVVGGYNAKDLEQDPDELIEDEDGDMVPRGYSLDYPDTFYNHANMGSVRVLFEPKCQHQSKRWVKRTIVHERQPFPT
jgi:UDP-2,3-diacylglucosamine pyrophosphatase LpxH